MSTATQAPTRDERFVGALEDLLKMDDRAAMAALRRGLGKRPGAAMEMHPYVVPYTQGLIYERDEEPYYIVAALFGFYPTKRWQSYNEKGQTNLGASFKLLAAQNEGGESIQRRFVALLNCDAEDLPDHLRQAISLLKSKDIPVDWLQLLRDIKRWESDERRVQRRWARAFWGDATKEMSSPQTTNPNNTLPSSQDVETVVE